MAVGELSALSPATIAAGEKPYGVAITPNGKWVLVANRLGESVTVYSRNTSTGALTSHETVACGFRTCRIVISPDEKHVYVSTTASKIIQFAWNTETGVLTGLEPKTVTAGESAENIAISADGKDFYCANNGSSSVSQFSRNSTTGQLTAKSPASVSTGAFPNGIVVVGANVYVASASTEAVYQYKRGSEGKLEALSPASVAAGLSPEGLAASGDEVNVYCANRDSPSVSQYKRGSEGKLEALSPASVAAGTKAHAVAVSADGLTVYCANEGANTVSQYSRDKTTGKLTALSPATVGAGTEPYGVVGSPDSANVYVNNEGSANVSQYAAAVTAPALIQLNPAASHTTASLAVGAPTCVPLVAAASASSASLAVTVSTRIPLVAAIAHSAASLILTIPERAPVPGPVVPGKPAIATFSYYAFDFLTGAFLGQLPLRTVTFGKQLNSPGTLKGTLDLSDPRVQATFPIGLTIPNRSFVVADYKGAPVWGGVVLPREPKTESSGSSTTGTLDITCSETWAYFQHRVQATDYSSPPFSGISAASPMNLWVATPFDASIIACQVIEDALGYADGVSIPHGNPLGGMTVMLNGAIPSGPVAPPTDWVAVNYPFPSMQLVDTIVNQLSQLGLGIGFDYAVDIAYSAGSPSPPVGTVNLSYPRRGRTVEQNSLLIDVTTARNYSFPEQGGETANRIYELGGTGAISVSENTFAQEQGYALWERIMSRANIQSQNIMGILAQTGLSDLALYSYPPVTPSVALSINDPNLPLGSFIEGDDVQVLIPALNDRGEIFDPRFPGGLDQEYRITGYNVEPLDQGDAVVKLSLAAPPYTEALAPTI